MEPLSLKAFYSSPVSFGSAGPKPLLQTQSLWLEDSWSLSGPILQQIYFYDEVDFLKTPSLWSVSFSSLLSSALTLGAQVAYLEI